MPVYIPGLLPRTGAPSLISLVVSVDVKHHVYLLTRTGGVSRFGLAVRRYAGKRKDLGSIPLRLSFLFKKVVVCGQSCDFVHHLKWLSSLPILMQKSF